MPTTGLPLPLVSCGGNSLMSSLVILGLLVRCSLIHRLIGGRPGSLDRLTQLTWPPLDPLLLLSDLAQSSEALLEQALAGLVR